MKWDKCLYLTQRATPAELARAYQELHNQIAKALDKKIDGYNIASAALGPGLTLSDDNPPQIINQLFPIPLPSPSPVPPKPPPPVPPSVPTGPGFMPKQNSANGDAEGMEVWVKAGTTNGKFCVVDAGDTTATKRQLFSLIPDASSGANPGCELKTPLGALTLDTGGAFNVILQRNGTTEVTLDGTNALVRQALAQQFGTAFKVIFASVPTAERTWTFPDTTQSVAGFTTGTEANLPNPIEQGQLYLTTDTYRLFYGGGPA